MMMMIHQHGICSILTRSTRGSIGLFSVTFFPNPIAVGHYINDGGILTFILVFHTNKLGLFTYAYLFYRKTQYRPMANYTIFPRQNLKP